MGSKSEHQANIKKTFEGLGYISSGVDCFNDLIIVLLDAFQKTDLPDSYLIVLSGKHFCKVDESNNDKTASSFSNT